MPQWNCACPNCREARLGLIPPRTQSSVAVGDERGRWYLVNASPDLPAQIEAYPPLQPAPQPFRNTPIAGVLLTNADLDHVLGLFSLREGGRLVIHATNAVRATVTRGLGLTPIIDTFCGADWREPSIEKFVPLLPGEDDTAGLLYRAIPLPGTPPPYAREVTAGGAHSVAYQFLDPRTGGRLLVAPDVAAVNDELRQALAASDAVLFDGTFWSGDDLSQVKSNAPQAAEMGHVTMKDCSLELLRNLTARHKIYIHINNTNPVLGSVSPERAAVEAAGITIGRDGLEFQL